MQTALVTKSPIGWFAFSAEGELLASKVFRLADAIMNYDRDMPDDFKTSLNGYAVQQDIRADRFLRPKIRELAKNTGFASGDVELNRFLTTFATELSKKRLVGVIGRDKLLIQAVGALDDISRSTNGVLMRLSEWFGLHYPELKLSNEKLVDIVQEYGRRESIPGFVKSVGVTLTEDDVVAIKGFASVVAHMLVQKRCLEHHVRSVIRELATNFSALVDPLLAARLLSLAGSLEKLSKMSSSTIQLMGAEKALFRHLREKGKAPKFGIIFMSDWIQGTPENMRGKVARVLSAKLMMAARIDYYSGRNDSVKLRKELEEDIANLRKSDKI